MVNNPEQNGFSEEELTIAKSRLGTLVTFISIGLDTNLVSKVQQVDFLKDLDVDADVKRAILDEAIRKLCGQQKCSKCDSVKGCTIVQNEVKLSPVVLMEAEQTFIPGVFSSRTHLIIDRELIRERCASRQLADFLDGSN